jgi:hypothetical protein
LLFGQGSQQARGTAQKNRVGNSAAAFARLSCRRFGDYVLMDKNNIRHVRIGHIHFPETEGIDILTFNFEKEVGEYNVAYKSSLGEDGARISVKDLKPDSATIWIWSVDEGQDLQFSFHKLRKRANKGPTTPESSKEEIKI